MIAVDELPEPRPHHYVFAHQWLPRFATTKSEAFFSLFGSRDGPAAMSNFWETVGESLPAEFRLPSDGLHVHWEKLHEGIRALIVELPAPEAMTEAYFVAAVAVAPNDEGEVETPVFCLQYAHGMELQGGSTAVASWEGSGYQLIGAGPEPTLEAWTTWLKLRFAPLLN